MSLYGTQRNSHVEFLKSHGHGIESIILPRWPQSYFTESQDDRTFWTEFPSIQLLGAPSMTIAHMNSPPPNHPIHHLFLCDDGEYFYEAVIQPISRISTLHHLSMDSYGVSRSQLNTLKQICEERNIKLSLIPYQKRFVQRLAQNVPSWGDLVSMYDVVRSHFYGNSS